MIANYIKERRWFRAKSRPLATATAEELFPLRLAGEDVLLAIVLCTYEDGGVDRYVLPIATATGSEAERLERDQPHLVIGPDTGGLRYDALGSERLLAALLELFRGEGTRVESGRGTLVFKPYPAIGGAWTETIAPKPTKTEQTNTSIVFGDAFILKIVRKLDEGVSAELEMGEFLTRHGYASSPQVVGAIELERPGTPPSTVGVLHRFVANQGDAWTATLQTLAAAVTPETYLPQAALLGTRVGEMHVVLASGTEPAFRVEHIRPDDRATLAAAVAKQAEALAPYLRDTDPARIAARVASFVDQADDPIRMRIHGDLHLGQILAIGEPGKGLEAKPPDEFILIDFEGEPARSLEERKGKRSPLADVAGMLRSFDYAAATALRARSPAAARAWYRAVANGFLSAYRVVTRRSAALAVPDDEFNRTLDFYLLEKCLYEIAYEANNRPDWIAIPRDGLFDLLEPGP